MLCNSQSADLQHEAVLSVITAKDFVVFRGCYFQVGNIPFVCLCVCVYMCVRVCKTCWIGGWPYILPSRVSVYSFCMIRERETRGGGAVCKKKEMEINKLV